MERSDAFHSMFGGDTSLANKEAIDTIKSNLVPSEAERAEIGPGICDEVDFFHSDKEGFVLGLEEDDPRVPLLKQMLEELALSEASEKPDNDMKPEAGIEPEVEKTPDTAPEVKKPVSTSAADMLAEAASSGFDDDEDIPPRGSVKKPAPTKPVRKPRENKGNERNRKAEAGEQTEEEKKPEPKPWDVLPVDQRPKPLPVKIRAGRNEKALLESKRYHEDRAKIEGAHEDGDVSTLNSWKAYLDNYARGNSGEAMRRHGHHLLKLIHALEEGSQKDSAWYMTHFVDGTEREETNNPS
jgi:hypothetical protein